MTFAFVIMAFAPTVPLVTVGWCLAQLGANVTLAPFIATISDQVPKFQRGKVSAAARHRAERRDPRRHLRRPALRDSAGRSCSSCRPSSPSARCSCSRSSCPTSMLKVKPPRMNCREWIGTFWVNPLKYPDFALAWWSRFLITLASFMFTTFRLFYMQDRPRHLRRTPRRPRSSDGVLIYTIALVARGCVAGKLSDRSVAASSSCAGSTAMFAIGTVAAGARRLRQRVLSGGGVLGMAFGIYVGVDLALVVDVLPNPDDAGKDLGVFNIANALPQTAAPGSGRRCSPSIAPTTRTTNLLLYTAGAAALIGALVIIPIKKVK